MKACLRLVSLAMALGTSAMCLSGCVAFRQSVMDVNPDKAKPMDANYDYSDQRTMTDEIAQAILSHAFMQKEVKAPIAVILGIENRTRRHIETKTIGDTLQGNLLRSGKLQFVNASRRDELLREQNYQAQHATKDSAASIGRQLGAKYMITGSISDDVKRSGRQVRVSAKEEIYYLLTVEVTDLETGLIVAAPQAERVRQASKPIIGW